MSDQTPKYLFFLPNLFTTFNMGCGAFSLILTERGQYYSASMLLVLGAVFDMVDGKVAKLTHTQSHFGEHFDSLSDLISFGLAPAFLIHHVFFQNQGRLGFLIAFFYLLCVALRLARFNAKINQVDNRYFEGLPSPAGAFCLIGLVCFAEIDGELVNYFKTIASLVILVSGLMVSQIPFASFKSSDLIERHKRKFFVLILVILLSTLYYEELMIGFWSYGYLIGSLVHYLLYFNKHAQMD